MKNSLLLAATLLLVWTSCSQQDDFNAQDAAQGQQPLTPAQINQEINTMLAEKGSFDWSQASDYLLWSAIVQSDSLASVGYGDQAFDDAIMVRKSAAAHDLVINTAQESENLASGKKNDQSILVRDNDQLTTLDLRITQLNTVTELRNNPSVRYLEPAGYQYMRYQDLHKSDSGCDQSGDAINAADYRLITPNCYVSWVYDRHNIPSAWGYSTGAGITVGVVDTGASGSQPLLNGEFNDGYSSGRTIQRYGVFVDSFWPWVTKTDGIYDKCSHGTSMTANVSSPRNNNYMPVGVAYNCNMVAYRATGDVVLEGYHEQVGVETALMQLANRSDVKIISMSIGHILSVGRISDAIKYAYSKGKLIFAAGGTSTSFTNFTGVIFPASMAETVAVTGITDAGGYTECEVCHKGDAIDFTVVMQRASDASRTSPTTGFTAGSKQYIGGSSIATSTTAGIAALVWAKNPTWTRAQVLNKMIQSASLYPSRSSNFGWGNVDALKAVQ
ncbi:MAG: hypothetical protein RIS47_2184 [Bacteroidota bacterium]|jgi:subtilisin family serine protease